MPLAPALVSFEGIFHTRLQILKAEEEPPDVAASAPGSGASRMQITCKTRQRQQQTFWKSGWTRPHPLPGPEASRTLTKWPATCGEGREKDAGLFEESVGVRRDVPLLDLTIY